MLKMRLKTPNNQIQKLVYKRKELKNIGQEKEQRNAERQKDQ